MPAEWEVQESVWLSWPHNLETFGDLLPEVRNTFLDIIRVLHTGQFVDLLVKSEEEEQEVLDLLLQRRFLDTRVRVHILPTEDVWIRDYGPTFTIDLSRTRRRGVCWEFNAWGEKYDDLVRDDGKSVKISELAGSETVQPGIVLEGGSIDLNGTGLLMTTEQCLLNPNRNPGLARSDIETILSGCLGVDRVIWLGEGIEGDDTDGHVDDICRFVDEKTVVIALEEDPADPNYAVMKDNLHRLELFARKYPNPLEIVPLPLPGYVKSGNKRLPASYANFFIGNDTVAVPVFEAVNDEKALQVLRKVFPTRRVMGIDCRALVEGLGTIHCVTQQLPQLADRNMFKN